MKSARHPIRAVGANANGGFSSHILPTSANLVGVCIMSLSLVKLLPRQGWSSLVDEVLAIDSLIFLASVALSYASLRFQRQSARLENWAESFFLAGLLLVMLSSLILAYGIG
ncbi:MAG: hypothetical protein B7Y41_10610 [Hydrogenophilales bacterium 28-61-23]|nr:MAG: hypothetical protein B7Y41_10610 [Hydrogenophilales bacterium 28-61-23]